MKENEQTTYCGFVALIGRPNVGKSTLLNKIIGEKVSITADKPQTTRHKIIGLKTVNNKQAVYIDTPGLHKFQKKAINKYMNKVSRSTLKDVDIVVFVVEAGQWREEDEQVLELLKNATSFVVLVINKADLLADKAELLPYIEKLNSLHEFQQIIPLSAKTGEQVNHLQEVVLNNIPQGPYYFEKDSVTDKSMPFRITEIIREKLTRELGKELPYALTVELEQMREEEEQFIIHAIIFVERDSQKRIVIGSKGSNLKKVGTAARKDINRLLDKRTHLELWVKVKDGWTDDTKSLNNLGYNDI